MKADYYVYVYWLRGVPVYVGKGRGNRDREHLKVATSINAGTLKGERSRWYNFIAKRVREGASFDIERVADNLDEGLAMLLEIQLIEQHGRIVFDTDGTLLNCFGGGDGFTAEDAHRRAMRPRARNRSRQVMLARHADPIEHAKIIESMKASLARPEVKVRHVAKIRENASNPVVRANISSAMRKALASPEARKQRSDAATKQWSDPAIKDRQRQSVLASWADPVKREQRLFLRRQAAARRAENGRA